MRAGPPEDTRQLLLVAGTSGRPTENLSRSPLGDGRAGGIKVWRELDLTLKKGVWKVASGLEGNIHPSGRAQIKQEMTSDWP